MGKFADVVKGAKEFDEHYKELVAKPKVDLNGKSTKVGVSVKGSPHEIVIQKQILDWCKAHPQYVKRVWRNNTQGRIIQTAGGPIMGASFSTGTSDLLGWLVGGLFLAIEVKRPGGYITPTQRNFIDSCARDGGCGVVATSCNDVICAIEKVLRLASGTIPRL